MLAGEDQPIPPLVTLTDALTDLDWFGRTFASPSFWTWKVVAKLIDGIALTEQRECGCSCYLALIQPSAGRKS
jgi:hypothetical protein